MPRTDKWGNIWETLEETVGKDMAEKINAPPGRWPWPARDVGSRHEYLAPPGWWAHAHGRNELDDGRARGAAKMLERHAAKADIAVPK